MALDINPTQRKLTPTPEDAAGTINETPEVARLPAKRRRGHAALIYRERVARITRAREARGEQAFETGMKALLQFVTREGHADVRVAHKETLPAETADVQSASAGNVAVLVDLGRWVANQRAKYHRGKMPEDQIAKLQGLKGWHWDAWDRGWEEATALLTRYVETHRHPRVPASYRDGGFALGAWVARQRRRYQAGRLSAEKIGQLKQIPQLLKLWKGVKVASVWDLKFAALVNFAKKQGHTDVPRQYLSGSKNIRLGVWVNSMRTRYNRGSLSSERIKRLEGVPGWHWSSPRIKEDAPSD